MMLDSPHTLVPMLMRGNTQRSHCGRDLHHTDHVRAGNPPNLQPATVREEERGGRGPTSRRTSMRAAPVAGHHRLRSMRRRPAPAPATPPQKQDAVHSELRPGTGKAANAGTGPPRRATRQAAGHARAAPPQTPDPPS
jgi:hypothetical protein